MARKVEMHIPKLIDCKVHFDDEKDERREETSIFLTEGDSAGGAMIQSRDVYTQAIFSLKGKPLNVFGLKRDTVYKNEELYNIMRALGIEDGLEGLRYNRVVIATDADVDGMHIRNLLLTFFLHYFEELVLKDHVNILETPLFRVRTKTETVYCYSEAERDAAMKRLKGAEVTRFKGLGEISPGRVQAVHRRRHAPDPRAGAVHGRRAPDPGVPHGQEHARAAEVHREQPARGSAGRSVNAMQRRNTWVLVLVVPVVVGMSLLVQLGSPVDGWQYVLVRSLAVSGYLLVFLAALSSASLPAVAKTFGRPFIGVHHVATIAGFVAMFAHPFAYALAIGSLEIFVPRADSVVEFFRWGGRLALVLFLVAVVAALLRLTFKKRWRSFHLAVYLGFLLATVHANLIGTTFLASPIVRVVSWLMAAAATVVFVRKRIQRLGARGARQCLRT